MTYSATGLRGDRGANEREEPHRRGERGGGTVPHDGTKKDGQKVGAFDENKKGSCCQIG